MMVDGTTAPLMYVSWGDEEGQSGTEEFDKKGWNDLLSKSKSVFFRARAKVSMRSFSTDVHLVTDEGEPTDVVFQSETF